MSILSKLGNSLGCGLVLQSNSNYIVHADEPPTINYLASPGARKAITWPGQDGAEGQRISRLSADVSKPWATQSKSHATSVTNTMTHFRPVRIKQNKYRRPGKQDFNKMETITNMARNVEAQQYIKQNRTGHLPFQP